MGFHQKVKQGCRSQMNLMVLVRGETGDLCHFFELGFGRHTNFA